MLMRLEKGLLNLFMEKGEVEADVAKVVLPIVLITAERHGLLVPRISQTIFDTFLEIMKRWDESKKTELVISSEELLELWGDIWLKNKKEEVINGEPK